MITIIADVHGAAALLRRLVDTVEGPLLILGDLINFVDYRTLDGIVTQMVGRELSAEMVRLRSQGRFDEARAGWQAHTAGREEEMRDVYRKLVEAEYRAVGAALEGVEAFVTFGNVDRPRTLRRHLPATARFVDTQVIELDGATFGFAGGGIDRGLGIPGEVGDEEMEAKLERLGGVDVLCTHVPPAIGPLSSDVVGGPQKGSEPVLRFIHRHRPAWHYFGDIHQPQAVAWRVGVTRCVNAGYFRATGRGVRHG